MVWTDVTKRALSKAAELHHDQYRKGGMQAPYVTHVIAVADMVRRYTADENIIAAALLHDLLEDTSYTVGEMRTEFGDTITDIVLGVSIPEKVDGTDTHENMVIGRARYIATLERASAGAALVAAADKIHNFESIVHEYAHSPLAFKKDFRGSSDDRLRVYGAIVQALQGKIPDALRERLAVGWNNYRTLITSL